MRHPFERRQRHFELVAAPLLLSLANCQVDDGRILYPGETSTSGRLNSDAGSGGTDASCSSNGSCEKGGTSNSNGSLPAAGGGASTAGTASTSGESSTGGAVPTAGASGSSGSDALGGSPATTPVSCTDRNSNGKADSSETLVQNSTFDLNSDPWDPESGVGMVWNPKDACDSSKSGSLSVTFTKTGSATSPDAAGAFQCVAGAANTNYAFSAQMYISTTGSRAGVGLMFYSSVDCTGTPLGDSLSSLQSLSGKWTLAAVNAVAPPGTKSLAARLVVGRADWTTTQVGANAYADAVLLLKVQ